MSHLVPEGSFILDQSSWCDRQKEDTQQNRPGSHTPYASTSTKGHCEGAGWIKLVLPRADPLVLLSLQKGNDRAKFLVHFPGLPLHLPRLIHGTGTPKHLPYYHQKLVSITSNYSSPMNDLVTRRRPDTVSCLFFRRLLGENSPNGP